MKYLFQIFTPLIFERNVRKKGKYLMPFGFITVQYMNNLRDHVVTIFNVLFCIIMT